MSGQNCGQETVAIRIVAIAAYMLLDFASLPALLQLESLDGTPIPPLTLEQALHSGALLAYELDGKPLAPSQGFPLRCVVPGFGGRRNAKWVSKVTVVGGEESSRASPGGSEPHACECGSSRP